MNSLRLFKCRPLTTEEIAGASATLANWPTAQAGGIGFELLSSSRAGVHATFLEVRLQSVTSTDIYGSKTEYEISRVERVDFHVRRESGLIEVFDAPRRLQGFKASLGRAFDSKLWIEPFQCSLEKLLTWLSDNSEVTARLAKAKISGMAFGKNSTGTVDLSAPTNLQPDLISLINENKGTQLRSVEIILDDRNEYPLRVKISHRGVIRSNQNWQREDLDIVIDAVVAAEYD